MVSLKSWSTLIRNAAAGRVSSKSLRTVSCFSSRQTARHQGPERCESYAGQTWWFGLGDWWGARQSHLPCEVSNCPSKVRLRIRKILPSPADRSSMERRLYLHTRKKFATDIWLRLVPQDKIDTQTNAVNHEPLPNSIRVLRCDDIRRQGLSCNADTRDDWYVSDGSRSTVMYRLTVDRGGDDHFPHLTILLFRHSDIPTFRPRQG
jgi:hypothetical protein